MAELIIQTGKHQGKKLVLSQAEIIVGRSPECHVRVTTGEVSKRHCLLRSTADGLFVRDLGSRNGTFVNDAPIERETLLKPGDRLRIGGMEFQLPPRPGKARPDARRAGISDDEIAHWLTDEPGEPDPSGDTTTIIATEAAPETPPPPAEPPRKPFKTIADEAADIIQRWRDKQGGEQA